MPPQVAIILRLLNSFSTASANIVPPGTIQKKIDKKLRYFRLPPNFAHRKYIDLPNHLPSFTPYTYVRYWSQQGEFGIL